MENGFEDLTTLGTNLRVCVCVFVCLSVKSVEVLYIGILPRAESKMIKPFQESHQCSRCQLLAMVNMWSLLVLMARLKWGIYIYIVCGSSKLRTAFKIHRIHQNSRTA